MLMIPANENYRRKCVEEEKEGRLRLVKVWVPKDKTVEIKAMAIGLLKESIEGGREQREEPQQRPVGSIIRWKEYFKGLKLFSRWRGK